MRQQARQTTRPARALRVPRNRSPLFPIARYHARRLGDPSPPRRAVSGKASESPLVPPTPRSCQSASPRVSSDVAGRSLIFGTISTVLGDAAAGGGRAGRGKGLWFATDAHWPEGVSGRRSIGNTSEGDRRRARFRRASDRYTVVPSVSRSARFKLDGRGALPSLS